MGLVPQIQICTSHDTGLNSYPNSTEVKKILMELRRECEAGRLKGEGQPSRQNWIVSKRWTKKKIERGNRIEDDKWVPCVPDPIVHCCALTGGPYYNFTITIFFAKILPSLLIGTFKRCQHFVSCHHLLWAPLSHKQCQFAVNSFLVFSARNLVDRFLFKNIKYKVATNCKFGL
jgi:hypothetical protein